MKKRHRNRTHGRHEAMPADVIAVEVEEAFIPPDQYHELIGLDDCPNLASFPDGIYVVGRRVNGETQVGYFAESQIDKMSGEKLIG